MLLKLSYVDNFSKAVHNLLFFLIFNAFALAETRFIASLQGKMIIFVFYFPDYTIKRGEKTIQEVTIRHLMTMKAPYKCKGDPWTKVCASENRTTASLDLLGGRKGLTDEFNYQTVCLHILSGILYRATKMKTVDFADQYLFGPIGIGKHTNHFAKSAEEHKKFTVGKEPKGQIWLADPQGLGTIGYGLCISADDMAKIGQLCLDNGMTNGRQVVSANWIKTITTPTFTTDKRFGNMKYGMLWWIIDCQKPIYAACGNSGNIIYVDEQYWCVNFLKFLVMC